MNRMLSLFVVFMTTCILLACGGGAVVTPIPQPVVVSNAKVGDGFVFADGQWNYPDPTGKWLIRGTSENDAFGLMPVWWYLPKGQPNGRDWWTLTNTPQGLLSSASPSENAYNGSFVNDAFITNVYVKDKPIVYFDYDILKFSGDRVRATIGISLRYPDGSQFYIERNIRRTDNFDLCSGFFDRCAENSYYFPPAPGPMDVRALLLQVLPTDKVDSLRIAGIYIGSEIYGTGQVDLLIKSYGVTK